MDLDKESIIKLILTSCAVYLVYSAFKKVIYYYKDFKATASIKGAPIIPFLGNTQITCNHG